MYSTLSIVQLATTLRGNEALNTRVADLFTFTYHTVSPQPLEAIVFAVPTSKTNKLGSTDLRITARHVDVLQCAQLQIAIHLHRHFNRETPLSETDLLDYSYADIFFFAGTFSTCSDCRLCFFEAHAQACLAVCNALGITKRTYRLCCCLRSAATTHALQCAP